MQDIESELLKLKSYHVTVGKSLNCSMSWLPHQVYVIIANIICHSIIRENYTLILHWLQIWICVLL